ncbi:bifunctional P-loop containing nucleoside triphosphate hydrolase/Thymidylate kinase-like domain/Thymidylate kinase [Babesia duncani]|uniref:dTMP kinase n=1 Tax=Babesia duncani TaxID=323732 RepID=A0AAD9PKW1_9APIC|nr:bifunctional P-loop containing nucleoside triphosphate hydrolase/Thymidylate kinase-like domain/Thymidylate kinase [Babesia duncani]
MEDKLLTGKLIAFEGIDRTGKSTQIQLLSQRLQALQIKHEIVRFPDRNNTIGSLIHQVLTCKEKSISKQTLHLLFSAERWYMYDKIVEYLSNGIHVILDRYAYAGIAYSTGAQNLDYNWTLHPDTGLVEPDIVFYMSMPPKFTKDRNEYGKELYEREDIQTRVFESYKRFSSLPYWTVIDANTDLNVIENEIYENVKNILSKNARKLSESKVNFQV